MKKNALIVAAATAAVLVTALAGCSNGTHTSPPKAVKTSSSSATATPSATKTTPGSTNPDPAKTGDLPVPTQGTGTPTQAQALATFKTSYCPVIAAETELDQAYQAENLPNIRSSATKVVTADNTAITQLSAATFPTNYQKVVSSEIIYLRNQVGLYNQLTTASTLTEAQSIVQAAASIAVAIPATGSDAPNLMNIC